MKIQNQSTAEICKYYNSQYKHIFYQKHILPWNLESPCKKSNCPKATRLWGSWAIWRRFQVTSRILGWILPSSYPTPGARCLQMISSPRHSNLPAETPARMEQRQAMPAVPCPNSQSIDSVSIIIMVAIEWLNSFRGVKWRSKMVICYGAVGNQTTNWPVKVPAVGIT